MSDISVVLIEDHDLTRIGLRTALKQQSGIQIVGEAANALQGLKVLDTTQPNVAVVDIGLPDMDGIDLTQQFRQLQEEKEARLKQLNGAAEETEYRHTRVLILTMHDSEDAVLAAFGAGADSYCMKDVSIERLVEAIQATHSGSSWIDPAIANVVLHQIRQTSSNGRTSHSTKTVEISAMDSEFEQVLESYPLTQRELEILELIVSGYSNAAIADKLYITVGTVKTHVRNILSKLCAEDRTQAAVRALRSGLVG